MRNTLGKIQSVSNQVKIQLNFSTTSTLGLEESGCYKEVAVEEVQIKVNAWIICLQGQKKRAFREVAISAGSNVVMQVKDFTCFQLHNDNSISRLLPVMAGVQKPEASKNSTVSVPQRM